jgi:ribosomal protein S18 acetylase RimI-like enzyme
VREQPAEESPQETAADAASVIRKLTVRDVDEAGDLLACAFFDYPMITWLMPDAAPRRIALPIFMRVSVRWGLLMKEVFGIGDPLRGVAIWAPPGMVNEDLDPDDSIVRYSELLSAIGADAEVRYERFLAEQRIVRDAELGAQTWYLAWLGVDPAQQRSGAGAALLRDMFNRLDLSGGDAYLETEKSANVPYYEQHGFGVVTHGAISGGGPDFWTLRRAPEMQA